jgi:hypothetical protein
VRAVYAINFDFAHLLILLLLLLLLLFLLLLLLLSVACYLWRPS